MSVATHRPLLPLLPSSIVSKSERDPSVSYLKHLSLAYANNCQIQDSGPGLFANAQNILITDGTFVVSISCGFLNN